MGGGGTPAAASTRRSSTTLFIEMRRLAIYAVTVLAGTVVGLFAWGLAEARLGLAAVDLALVLGLLWLAHRFPKPRFAGGTSARVLYLIAGSCGLFTIGVLRLVPVYAHQFPACGPARVGVCEPAGPVLNMTRIWLALAGIAVAFLTLLAGLMASVHQGRDRSERRPWHIRADQKGPYSDNVV